MVHISFLWCYEVKKEDIFLNIFIVYTFLSIILYTNKQKPNKSAYTYKFKQIINVYSNIKILCTKCRLLLWNSGCVKFKLFKKLYFLLVMSSNNLMIILGKSKQLIRNHNQSRFCSSDLLITYWQSFFLFFVGLFILFRSLLCMASFCMYFYIVSEPRATINLWVRDGNSWCYFSSLYYTQT